MALVYITRIETFNAAHRLANPAWTDEKNYEVFGKCANPNFHGHNYTLSVTLCGKMDANTGFIFNAKTLGDIIEREIIEMLDHKNLNLDVAAFKNVFPSVENIVVVIWNILAPILERALEGRGRLYKIVLQETPTIIAEYMGE